MTVNEQPAGPSEGIGKPGDEADPGTPGSGDDLCPVCSGRGEVNGARCRNCAGTGTITRGIGGG